MDAYVKNRYSDDQLIAIYPRQSPPPLIEKGVITQDEFMEKIKAERAMYQEMLEKVK